MKNIFMGVNYHNKYKSSELQNHIQVCKNTFQLVLTNIFRDFENIINGHTFN